MERARAGNERARRSRFCVMARSTSSLARMISQPMTRRGRQPRRCATPNADRSYQPSWRSIDPRSSRRVLISMTSMVPLAGSNASRSIHPCERLWTISTSRAVPPTDSLQAALDVRGTSSVDEVGLAKVPDDRRDTCHDVDPEIQSDRYPLGKIERRVCLRRLNLGDVAACHADHVAELLLGQAKSGPSLTAEARERHPDRHRLSEARVPSPSLTWASPPASRRRSRPLRRSRLR